MRLLKIAWSLLTGNVWGWLSELPWRWILGAAAAAAFALGVWWLTSTISGLRADNDRLTEQKAAALKAAVDNLHAVKVEKLDRAKSEASLKAKHATELRAAKHAADIKMEIAHDSGTECAQSPAMRTVLDGLRHDAPAGH